MNIQPGSAKIVDLRRLLREKFPASVTNVTQPSPEASAGRLSDSLPPSVFAEASAEMEVPAAGRSGFNVPLVARGTITEVVSPRLNAGNGLLIHDLLHGAAGREQHGQYVALIDGRDAFDPQSAGLKICGKLLWARCRTAAEAIKAADLLLRDGNISLVAMDLQLNPLLELGRLPGSCWYRLRSLAEKSGAALIALTPQRLIASAHLRVELDGAFSLDAFDVPREDLSNKLMLRVLRNRNRQTPLAERKAG